MSEKYRILSLEASDIVKQTDKNGEDKGYVLPEKNSQKYFKLFKNYFDWSMETEPLKECYAKKVRNKFSFQDDNGFNYTKAVIIVSFERSYKDEDKKPILNTLKLREKLYKDGFCVDGIKYIRYKRSAGSSREGKCG